MHVIRYKDTNLYWSNDQGWVYLTEATFFTPNEKSAFPRLPLDGCWECRTGMEVDDICPKTGDRHVPDMNSVTCNYDGDEVYIDVNCKDCGRSGCLGAFNYLVRSVQW